MIGGNVDEFQRAHVGPSIRALRMARDLELRGAAHVFTPSVYLRDLAIGWGVKPGRVSVLPNPAPSLPVLPPRDELRASFGMSGPTLAFAGRLTAQKSLEVAIAAVAAVEGVSLVIAGDGDERPRLEQLAGERVCFVGAQPRERVVELFAAADASILSSSWENFPHTVVEALAVGTPVIATMTGGVAEVVTNEENGLLVPAGDADGLAAAVRRYFEDAPLRERLRAHAEPSVARYAAQRVFGELESTLERVAR
jgi:glycosyltransferase involved in cell wall biosynthesis